MLPTTIPPSQKQLLETLTQRIRRLERSNGGVHPDRASSDGASSDGASSDGGAGSSNGSLNRDSVLRTTGVPALDGLLVERGLPRGCLMEWLEPGIGAGVETIALWAAVRARGPNELLMVIDSRGDFYAPGGAPLGLDVRTTVVIRPREPGEVLWTLEQALRTSGVGVVVCPWRRLSSQAFRRLQLAAEKGGSLGVLLRPARARGEPSFAEVRWGVQPLPSGESGARRWRVELWRARRQMTGGNVELELRDDNGRLHLVPAMVAATRIVEAARVFTAGAGDGSNVSPGDKPTFPREPT